MNRPVARGTVLVEAQIRKALKAAESPITAAAIHAQVRDLCPLEQLTLECIEVMVDQGRILRIGTGAAALFWWRDLPLRVSRDTFRTQVMG